MEITPTLQSHDGLSGPNLGPPSSTGPLTARIAARLFGWRLDYQLAAGAATSEHPALAARAARLATPVERNALASSIEEILAAADRPQRLSSRAPLNRPAVRAAGAELASVAALLQTSSPCNPRGIALVRLLLRDGASPLYGGGSERQLEQAVRQARLAMELGESG